jgi:HSP20 family molecular chaperone IbpA
MPKGDLKKMKTKRATERSETEMRQPVPIQADDALNMFDELSRNISRRAYEIFEARGRQDGYDLDDWLAAQNELLSQVPIAINEQDNRLIVSAEVPGFSDDELRVYVEAQRMLIKGRSRDANTYKIGETAHYEMRSKEIWRSIVLPAEVDPSTARGVLENGLLQMTIAKAEKLKSSGTEFHTEGLVESESTFQ